MPRPPAPGSSSPTPWCSRLSRRSGHPCGSVHFWHMGSAARSPTARPYRPATIFDFRWPLARGRAHALRGEVLGKLAAAHLVGLIEPEDIANMAVFLASEESRMVTGHVYPVDSGVTYQRGLPHTEIHHEVF